MKKRIVLTVVIASFICPIIAMKKRPLEPSEEQKMETTAEPSPAQKVKMEVEAQQAVKWMKERNWNPHAQSEIIRVLPPESIPMAAEPSRVAKQTTTHLPELPTETGYEILLKMAEELSKGATEEQKLYTAIENILNFMRKFPQYLGDRVINGELIKILARKYANNNVIKVAISFATTGAGQWLKQYRNEAKGDPERQIERQILFYVLDAARNNQVGVLRFINQYSSFSPLYGGGEPTDVFREALRHGSIDVLDWLASEEDFDINDWAKEYEIDLLMLAVRSDQLASVDWLLKRNIDPNIKNKGGNTPLMVAVKNGFTAIVNRLLEVKGINVNAINNYKVTALMVAATLGNTTLVDKILKVKNVEVNSRDVRGRTALMIAARHGNLAIVNLLLQVPGIEVNMRDMEGLNALADAAKGGHLLVVDRLLKVPEIAGNIPILLGTFVLATQMDHVAIAKQLFKILIRAKDTLGRTALMLAAYNGQTKIVEALLKAGSDVNAQDNDGKTASTYALESPSPKKNEIRKLLSDAQEKRE